MPARRLSPKKSEIEDSQICGHGTGGEWVEIFKGVKAGTNVRLAGEDVKKGEWILSRGTEIRPQKVGMQAALGRKEAWVYRRSGWRSGNEVIEVNAPWLWSVIEGRATRSI